MATMEHVCGHTSRYFISRPNENTTCPSCSSDFVTASTMRDKLKGQFADRYQQALSLGQSSIQHHYPVVAHCATICRYDCIVSWSNLTNDGYEESYIRELIAKALKRTEAHEWIHTKGNIAGLKAMASR